MVWAANPKYDTSERSGNIDLRSLTISGEQERADKLVIQDDLVVVENVYVNADTKLDKLFKDVDTHLRVTGALHISANVTMSGRLIGGVIDINEINIAENCSVEMGEWICRSATVDTLRVDGHIDCGSCWTSGRFKIKNLVGSGTFKAPQMREYFQNRSKFEGLIKSVSLTALMECPGFEGLMRKELISLLGPDALLRHFAAEDLINNLVGSGRFYDSMRGMVSKGPTTDELIPLDSLQALTKHPDFEGCTIDQSFGLGQESTMGTVYEDLVNTLIESGRLRLRGQWSGPGEFTIDNNQLTRL